MNDDEMIKDIKRLAGIGDSTSPCKAVVLVPKETDVAAMKTLLDKLKEIDGSVGQNWTEIDINGVKYCATGIIHDKPSNS